MSCITTRKKNHLSATVPDEYQSTRATLKRRHWPKKSRTLMRNSREIKKITCSDFKLPKESKTFVTYRKWRELGAKERCPIADTTQRWQPDARKGL
jgi:hypothetical protein